MIDLAFIVDASGSICDNDATAVRDQNGNVVSCNNWLLVKNLLNQVTRDLVIGERDAHLGLVLFSGRVDLIFDLNRLVVTLRRFSCSQKHVLHWPNGTRLF